MTKINRAYVTERSTSEAYFKHCKRYVRKYARTAPEAQRRLVRAFLDRMPECYTLIYAMIPKI